jgi:hypothetical protein
MNHLTGCPPPHLPTLHALSNLFKEKFDETWVVLPKRYIIKEIRADFAGC